MSPVPGAIETKKRGGKLSEEVIRNVVASYTSGEVPDYQMSALLMAIFIRGMDYDETLVLTQAMADSGGRHSFPQCVDKHSTGGVGDKISLTSLPAVAACGVPVAKLSGRGLGTTGGTIDKLESILGFSFDLSEESMRKQVEEVGLVIAEAGDLAPADKAIYALRDATGTVDSLPLIGSSIVSKKVATGCGYLLYDVKAGSGAFMKTADEARELADLLVRLSESLQIEASALITAMVEPLGSAVGNALEVRETVRFLQGESSPADLSEKSRIVAARLLRLKGIQNPDDTVERVISSGAAYEKFVEFVAAQGGDTKTLQNIPVSKEVREIVAPKAGHVAQFGALGVGRAAVLLGAGREKKGDKIDPGAGLEVLVKAGDEVEEDQPVARLYGERNAERAEHLVLEALKLSATPVQRPPVILGCLETGTVGDQPTAVSKNERLTTYNQELKTPTEGRQMIHVRAEPEELAESVLLPGDPRRAKYIAENFFEDARLVTEERGLLGYTGTYGGELVSVQTTGMGCPSTAIVTDELIQLGAKNLLRVGTCGGYHPEMKLGDLVIATAATPQDGTVSSITGGVPYAPAAHFDLVHAAYHAAEKSDRRPFLGPIVSADLFYDPEEDPQALWHSLGVLAVEMEASAIFTLAAMRGVRAGCLLTVSDAIGSDKKERIEDSTLKGAVDEMVGLALDTLKALH